MSTQSQLDADYSTQQVTNKLSDLFQAHASPVFYHLALQAAGIDPQAGQGSSLSVHNCEQLPMSAENPQTADDYPETIEELGYVSDATEALQSSIGRSKRRQLQVQGLVESGEAAHAKRLALCNRQSAQLRCPHMAGGCGCEDNYVPTTCDSRLCPTCMARRKGRAIEKYRGLISSMDHPTLGTFTIENVGEMALGSDFVRDSFGKLRRRVIPTEGTDGQNSWVWKRDGGAPADDYWKSAILGSREQALARDLQNRYVDQGKGIPFSELVDGGIYGIDIKEQEPGRYHIHIHTIWDCPFIPQPALSSVWEDITGASVVDIRRIDERGERGVESALLETIGYVCKAPSFETVDAEVDYLTALKGSRLIQPFGSLHGNTPRVRNLLQCSECERTPAYWDYLGLVDEPYDTMSLAAPQEDRPPPENM